MPARIALAHDDGVFVEDTVRQPPGATVCSRFDQWCVAKRLPRTGHRNSHNRVL
jgi:hypothetical protein